MELTELDRAERLACVALIKGIVLGDGRATGGEVEHTAQLGDAFGASEFRELMREASEKVGSEDELKKLLETVKRQPARNLIFGTAMETAFEDGLEGSESKLLDWLIAEWHIDMRVGE